jgi:hypothetical protein
MENNGPRAGKGFFNSARGIQEILESSAGENILINGKYPLRSLESSREIRGTNQLLCKEANDYQGSRMPPDEVEFWTTSDVRKGGWGCSGQQVARNPIDGRRFQFLQ